MRNDGLAWETLEETDEYRFERAEVPQGHLYRHTTQRCRVTHVVEPALWRLALVEQVPCSKDDTALLDFACQALRLLTTGEGADTEALSALAAIAGMDKLRALRDAEREEQRRPGGARPLVLGAISTQRRVVLRSRQ